MRTRTLRGLSGYQGTLTGKKVEGKSIKRIAEIYEWHGKDAEEVNEALEKLFERNGKILERGMDGQMTFIKRKGSKISLGKWGGEGGKGA